MPVSFIKLVLDLMEQDEIARRIRQIHEIEIAMD